MKTLLDFFTEMFEGGSSFSAINTAKSALLTCVTVDNSYHWNSDTDLVRFFKGVHNSRPPLPKYTSTWDVDIVLKHLGDMDTQGAISLKDLTLKAAMLVALTSGSRAQSIHLMNIDNTIVSQDKVSFFFDVPLKTSRLSRVRQIIEIKKLPGNKCCVFTAVTEYMKRTAGLRSTQALWVSWNKPHSGVSRDSISRWLKAVLSAAGINTKVFSAHSTRMAATSKASCLGVGLTSILATAGWNSATNFTKFYKRTLEEDNDRQVFAEAVLSNQKE